MSYTIGSAQVSNSHLAFFVGAPLAIIIGSFVHRKFLQKPDDSSKSQKKLEDDSDGTKKEEHAITPSDAAESGEMKEETLQKVQEEQIESATFVRLKGTPSLDRDLDGFVDRDVHFEDKRVSATGDIRLLYKDE